MPTKKCLEGDLIPFAIIHHMQVQDEQKQSKGKSRMVQRVIAKATLVHHVCIFDGTTNFLHLVNDRYKQSFTLADIRKQCSFQSTRSIYCFVLLNIIPVRPDTVECKFRSGWSTVNLPLVKCKSVASMFQPRVAPKDTTLVNESGSASDVNIGDEHGETQTGGGDVCITSPDTGTTSTVHNQVPVSEIREDYPKQSLEVLCDVSEQSGKHEEAKNVNAESCSEHPNDVSGVEIDELHENLQDNNIKAIPVPITLESEEPPKKRLRTDQPGDLSHEPESDERVVDHDTHHLVQSQSISRMTPETGEVSHVDNIKSHIFCTSLFFR